MRGVLLIRLHGKQQQVNYGKEPWLELLLADIEFLGSNPHSFIMFFFPRFKVVKQRTCQSIIVQCQRTEIEIIATLAALPMAISCLSKPSLGEKHHGQS